MTRRRLRTLAALCGLLTAAWWSRRRLLLVTVRGESMEPALHAGDRVLVRRTGAVKRHDVVVSHHRSDRSQALIVKRVAAVGGDPVPSLMGTRLPADHGRVPHGKLVVLGDNGARSGDSRHFGYLDRTDIIGVALAVRPVCGPWLTSARSVRPDL